MQINFDLKKPISKINEYQKRFWVEWALDSNGSAYNISLVYKIQGNLNRIALKQACDFFIKKHPVVQTLFNQDGSQQLHDGFTIDDIFKELVLPEHLDEEEFIKALLDKPYDLINEPLFNNFLFSNRSGDYFFIMKAQHVISDAVSSSIWAEEIASYYNAIVDNGHFPDNNSEFTEPAFSEQNFANSEHQSEASKFWRTYLEGAPLSVPFPVINGLQKNSITESLYFNFSEKETSDLKRFAKNNKTTLFIVLSALYGVLLSKYSGQKEILLSYPINVRPKGARRVMGCFVNNLPLKIDLKNNNTLKEIIKDLTHHQKNAKPYKNYSFTNIIQDARRNAENFLGAFNIGFAETNLNLSGISLNRLDSQSLDISSNQSIYDILLGYEHNNNKIKFRLKYKKNSIHPEIIKQFINHFKCAATSLINMDIDINQHSVVTQTELNKILYDWNATNTDFSFSQTIHQLFEEQVKKTPHAIAIIFKNQKLTYQELNQASNQLARYLRNHYQEKGFEFNPGTLILLCLDRSLEMIIGILGVLKAGGAYVPVDPSYPLERIQYILKDTCCHVTLTQTHLIP